MVSGCPNNDLFATETPIPPDNNLLFRRKPSLKGQTEPETNPESKSNEEAANEETSKELKGGLAAGEPTGASLGIDMNRM